MLRLTQTFIALALGLVLVPLAIPTPAQAACANAHLLPHTAAQTKKAQRATLCLINSQRRRHGLRSVHHHAALKRMATLQARDMIRHNYFGHGRNGWLNLAQRGRRAGYGGYSMAENIADGTRVTPAIAVRMWMNSSGHRRAILTSKYRDGGMTIKLRRDNYPLYVSTFGRR